MQMTTCRYQRLVLGITQRMLAELAGMQSARVMVIEGGVEPRLNEAVALASWLELDPATLMEPIEITPEALRQAISHAIEARAAHSGRTPHRLRPRLRPTKGLIHV